MGQPGSTRIIDRSLENGRHSSGCSPRQGVQAKLQCHALFLAGEGSRSVWLSGIGRQAFPQRRCRIWKSSTSEPQMAVRSNVQSFAGAPSGPPCTVIVCSWAIGPSLQSRGGSALWALFLAGARFGAWSMLFCASVWYEPDWFWIRGSVLEDEHAWVDLHCEGEDGSHHALS